MLLDIPLNKYKVHKHNGIQYLIGIIVLQNIFLIAYTSYNSDCINPREPVCSIDIF